MKNKQIGKDWLEGTFLTVKEAERTKAASVSRAGPKSQVVQGRPLGLEKAVRNMKVEDSDDSEPECKAEEYTETFTFAKNIRKPEDVLVGPLKNGFHPTNYLDLIADSTGTECIRRDRVCITLFIFYYLLGLIHSCESSAGNHRHWR